MEEDIIELFNRLGLKSKHIHMLEGMVAKQKDEYNIIKELIASLSPYSVGDKHPDGFTVALVTPCFTPDGEPVIYISDGKSNGNYSVVYADDLAGGGKDSE